MIFKMSFRIMFLFCTIFLMPICPFCHAEANFERVKREDVENSETFGQMFNDFISNLFGSDADTKEVATKQLNASSQEALKSFLSNISQSLTSATDNATGSNKPSQTKEVTAKTNGEAAFGVNDTNGATSSLASSYSSFTTSTTKETQSMLTSWLSSTTTFSPPEEGRCYTDAVFQNFCPVSNDMIDVSFWDLYSVLFSDTVLDALMIGCSTGSWCLKDRFDYWEALIVERVDMVTESDIATSMCQPELEPCIGKVADSFVNCSMHPQMVFTFEALKLVCELKQNTVLTTECYKHVITALHVTLADVMRMEGNNMESVSDDTCKSPEAHMTKGLICVANSCPSESETFHNFKPWAWFTSIVDDLIRECELDSTKCMALLQPPPGYVYGNEMGTLIGVSVATMVTALMLTIVVCTCYKRHRRNVVIKEGYQRLLNDGDES